MKRWSLLLVVLLLFALPAFAETAPSDGAAGEAQAAPSVEQARYHFEHRMLPTYFYERPEAMLDAVKRVGVFGLWYSFCTENNITSPYSEQDYVEHWYSSDDDTVIVQIEMPAPDATPLCARVYFVYNAQSGNAAYFTVEYDNLFGEMYLLGGWTEEHEHVNYGVIESLDRSDAGYADALRTEAEQVAELAGASPTLIPADIAIPKPIDEPSVEEAQDDDLNLIFCAELDFTIMADPSYAWDYQEGTGITVYTEHEGYIPYVIVWQGEDLIAEPFEYIKEQLTPFMQRHYGENLLGYEEYEAYELGGKQLPAGLYTYLVQDQPVEMLRLYDSTGERTVAFTAKYLQGEGEETMAALDTAIRSFQGAANAADA